MFQKPGVLFGFVAIVIGAILIGVFARQPNPTSPEAATKTEGKVVEPKKIGERKDVKPDVPNAPKSANVFIGQYDESPAPRKIHTVLSTRKGDANYQALIRYNPEAVPLTDVPGIQDILTNFAQQGKSLPSEVARIDQETEMLIDNLGQTLRSITSSHLFLNPLTGHVLAYDLANTTGGQAQRFVGHLTRQGVSVEVYRGTQPVDKHEIPFTNKETFIPVEMEFIYQWFKQNPEALKKKEPVKFSVFIPEVMSFVMLVAKPLTDEVIPIKDKTYECAHYEVVTVSTQAEGLYARQEMWFDKRSGLLMKRQDFEASLDPGDVVTMRGETGDLDRIQNLTVRPPSLPDKPFPYPLDQSLIYNVHSGDNDFGQIRVRFGRDQNDFTAAAKVDVDSRGVTRHESAATRFNSNWIATKYQAAGDEAEAENRATYSIGATLAGGSIEIAMRRQLEQITESNEKQVKAAATFSDQPKWTEPLVRVPINDDEAKAQASPTSNAKLSAQTFTRPLSTGTFLYDFNRVEHLAAFAYRLPLPQVTDGQPAKIEYQKVALYSVRQNRCGVVMFEIRAEPKPVLTEKQKKRLQYTSDEPQLFIAASNNAMLPCQMLLTQDGRLLELTLKYGNNNIVYTLDDPIMRRRAERERRQKLQEGPQVLRPAWW